MRSRNPDGIFFDGLSCWVQIGRRCQELEIGAKGNRGRNGHTRLRQLVVFRVPNTGNVACLPGVFARGGIRILWRGKCCGPASQRNTGRELWMKFKLRDRLNLIYVGVNPEYWYGLEKDAYILMHEQLLNVCFRTLFSQFCFMCPTELTSFRRKIT